MMIRISTLGGLALTDADGQVVQSVLSQPKRFALLFYLAAASPHGFQRRDTLAALFWPEFDTARARAALSRALYHLRRALGPETIMSRGPDELGLDRGRVWSDIGAFEQHLAADELEEALDLYRGELLPGFFLSDAAEFERWLDSLRSRLRERARAAIWSLIERALEVDDIDTATRLARRALEITADERALRTLITLLDGVGDRAAALREYENFARLLETDYDADPAPETRALIEAIRARETPSPLATTALSHTGAGAADDTQPEESGDSADQNLGSIVGSTPAAGSGILPSDRDLEILDTGVVGSSAPDEVRARTALGGSGAARVPPRQARPRARRLITPLLGATLLVASAIVLGFGTKGSPLRENRVLIATFEDRSDEPALQMLGRMTAEWIAQELAGTGLVDVVDPVTAAAAFADLAAASTAQGAGSGKRIRAAARRTGAGLVVSGTYNRQGDSLRIDAWVSDMRRGELLASVGPLYGDPADPLPALEMLRARVAGALATALDPRIEAIGALSGPPPRYVAYQAWMAGLDHFGRLDFPAAIPELRRAHELDSTFLAPLIWSALAFTHLSQWDQVEILLERLAGMREELVPFDRYFIDLVRALAEGRIAGEYEAVRRMVEVAPGSDLALFMLAQSALLMNRPAEALDVIARIRKDLVPPDFQVWMANTSATAFHKIGRYEEELELVRHVQAARPGTPLLINNEFAALAALGRIEEVQARAEAGIFQVPTAFSAWNVIYTAALELDAHGHQKAARELARRAEPIIRRQLAQQPADPRLRGYLAQILYLNGDLVAAEELFSALAAESQEGRLYNRGFAGVLAALRGERARAEAIAAELARDTSPYTFGAPTFWQARIAAALGEDDEAVDLLREAFARGYRTSTEVWHTIPEIRRLVEHPGFQELTRVKG